MKYSQIEAIYRRLDRYQSIKHIRKRNTGCNEIYVCAYVTIGRTNLGSININLPPYPHLLVTYSCHEQFQREMDQYPRDALSPKQVTVELFEFQVPGLSRCIE